MNLSKNLLADVKRLANEKVKDITDEELFHSNNFREYLESLIVSMTDSYTSPVTLTLYDDTSPGSGIACTNGKEIRLNLSNRLVKVFDTTLVRFMVQLGIVFHEVGHILFTDFEATKKALSTIAKGKFFGSKPKAKTVEEREALAELVEAMEKPALSNIFRKIFSDISNYVEDAHDEECMRNRFGSLIRNAIDSSETALRHRITPLEEMLESGENLTLMYSCILQIARFGEVYMTEEKSRNSDFMQKVYRIAPDIYIARETDDIKERFSRINQIVLNLWPYIKDELNKDPSGSNDGDGDGDGGDGDGQGDDNTPGNGNSTPQGGSTSQSQNPTPQQIAAVMQALEKGSSNSGTDQAAPMPTNRQTSAIATQLMAAAKDPNAPAPTPPATPAQMPQLGNGTQGDPGQNVLNQLLKAIATEQAEDEIEKSLASDIVAHIQTMDIAETHRGIPVKVSRILTVKDSDVTRYETFMQELREGSKRLQRGMKNILRDLKAGYTQHRKLTGRKLEASKSYRLDQRFYSNKKAPMDIPDMAIAFLVDESGSMSGPRHKAAMKATMLLHDFCMGMNIPVHVAGHKTEDQYVHYDILTDFNAVNKKDCYRLAKLKADGGGNRDGLAIEIAGSLLVKRPEETKLLFVLSDGQPNHRGYGGDSAKQDIAEIVAKYRRKGIEVIATAIGDDKSVIQSIYGESYLDITDLEKLPRELITIVKKRILPR